jgi:hypothetical protein
MNLTEAEGNLLLAGPFDLRVAHWDNDEWCAAIDTLAAKLGGDPAAAVFGIDARALP